MDCGFARGLRSPDGRAGHRAVAGVGHSRAYLKGRWPGRAGRVLQHHRFQRRAPCSPTGTPAASGSPAGRSKPVGRVRATGGPGHDPRVHIGEARSFEDGRCTPPPSGSTGLDRCHGIPIRDRPARSRCRDVAEPPELHVSQRRGRKTRRTWQRAAASASRTVQRRVAEHRVELHRSNFPWRWHRRAQRPHAARLALRRQTNRSAGLGDGGGLGTPSPQIRSRIRLPELRVEEGETQWRGRRRTGCVLQLTGGPAVGGLTAATIGSAAWRWSRSVSIRITGGIPAGSSPRREVGQCLFAVPRLAPTSCASSSWVMSWVTDTPPSTGTPNRSPRSSSALATRPGTSRRQDRTWPHWCGAGAGPEP